jgi:tetratricopeptide (TPR) repeat protein
MEKPEWATLQHYAALPYFVSVKFGKWQSILEMPESNVLYLRAIRHYARGMAYLGMGNPAAAQEELTNLKEIEPDSSLQGLTIWGINTLSSVVAIARRVLEGEYLVFIGRFAEGDDLLREAIVLEDHLNYDEPPDWFFSVRHHRAAVLIKEKRFEEALSMLAEDLQKHKKNGWALAGMVRVLEGMGNTEKATHIKKEFEAAWKYADVTITSSRILEQQ